MTGAERLVALLALGTLSAGLVSAGQVEPAAEQARATPAAVVVPAPTPTPAASPDAVTPSPAPATRRTPAAVSGAVPPALPRTGCPVPPRTGPARPPKPLPAPLVAEADLPAPLPVRPKATDLSAVRGKGIWATPFADDPVDVPRLVQLARTTGSSAIWIRTGGKKGYYGHRFLPALVPAAHAAGVKVIAWDFPYLSDPVADAKRAQQALVDGVDGFAPDIETAAEGTRVTARRVALYLSLVRAYAGTRPVVATVPRPTPKRASYPYTAFKPYADVLAPMVYWSCKEPGALVQESLAKLGRILPVAPVGQAYDMGSEGGRRGTPSRAETLRFLDAAKRGGAIGASLWTVEEAGQAQLEALRDYRWR